MKTTQMTKANELKIEAEIAKLIAETTKIQAEIRWYPWIVGTGGIAASLGLVLNFFK